MHLVCIIIAKPNANSVSVGLPVMPSIITGTNEPVVLTVAERNALVIEAYRDHVEAKKRFPAETIAPRFGIRPRTVYTIVAASKKKKPEPR